MDAKHFLNYIKKPSLLHQISYEELEAIVLQYPFNSNLRYLLLIKSKFENHEDYNKNLAIAAGYSVDRTFLYQLLQNEELLAVPQEELLEEEDILVLKDLGAVEQEIEMAELPSTVEKEVGNIAEVAKSMEVPVPKPAANMDEELLSEEPEEPVEEKIEEVIMAPASAEIMQEDMPEITDSKLLEAMNSLNALIENAIDAKGEQGSERDVMISLADMEEISSLTDKVKKMLPEETGEEVTEIASAEKQEEIILEKKEVKPAKKEKTKKLSKKVTASKKTEKPTAEKAIPRPKLKKAKKVKAKELAAKSIQSQNSVASETLAILLTKQGLYGNAIKMYTQLILTFPEKSVYFAAKIENLKNKI